MNRFIQFLFYNNTVPIVLGILFLGVGATFAASPEARQTVVTTQTALAAVDNSYIVETTITDTTVAIQINAITENSTTYFVEYQITTIGVLDGVWQPITKTNVLEVSKDSVISYDLGLYVAEELDELHAFETKKLKDAQEIERSAGVTAKVVATEYNGLLGQFFDPELQTFPKYDPLINPNVGIPLSNAQEAAHEVVRRLIEEEKQELAREKNDLGTVDEPESVLYGNEPASEVISVPVDSEIVPDTEPVPALPPELPPPPTSPEPPEPELAPEISPESL